MFRTALQMLMVTATGLAVACGWNANPVAPEIGDLEPGSVSENAKGGASPAGFTVEVFLGGELAGSNTMAVSNPKETGFNTSDITLDLRLLDVPASCTGFGTLESAIGSFSTGDLKHAWAAFFDFKVDGVLHYLDFRLAKIDGSADWLPVHINSMRGTEIGIQVNKGREKRGGCRATFPQDWEFRVTRNSV